MDVAGYDTARATGFCEGSSRVGIQIITTNAGNHIQWEMYYPGFTKGFICSSEISEDYCLLASIT
jgi:hypothetical protein